MERKVIQVSLSEDLVKELDHLAVDWGCSRTKVMEQLLRKALDQLHTTNFGGGIDA